MRILAVCGSLQARSSNRALLRTAHRVAPAGVEVIDSVPVGDVPAFNPDVERDGPAPAAVVEWRAQVAGAGGGRGGRRRHRCPHRSKRLTVSTWKVCGKASTSATDASR